MLRKLSALFLTAIITVGLVSACGKTENPENDTQGGTQTDLPGTEAPIDEEPESVDMLGQTVTVRSAYSNDGSDTFFGYRKDTVMEDKARARVAELNSKYNCVIEFNETDMVTNSTGLGGAAAAGLFYANIYQNETFGMTEAKKTGIFTGISTLADYIDYTNADKWGSGDMLLSVCWENDVYALFPCAWVGQMLNCYGYPITVNNDLLIEAGLTDLREYIENNTWNWQTFKDTLKAATVNNGETTVYAMAVHPPYLAQSLVLTNGVSIAQKNQEGDYTFGYFTPAAGRAFEYTRNIYKEECADCFDKKNTTPAAAVKAFLEENAVMVSAYAGDIFGVNSTITYTLDNLAFIPWPYGDDAQPEDMYNTFHESLLNAIALPVDQGTIDVEDVAVIMNDIFEPLDGLSTEDEKIAYYTDNIFFDARDVGYFYKMLGATHVNFYGEGVRSYIEQVMSSKKTLAELEEKNTGRYTELLPTDIVPAYTAMEKLFG